MPASGISEADVASAISGLKTAGIGEPSIRMIRQKLGKGSLTTIQRHKRAIDSEQRIKNSGVPDPIQETILNAVGTIWDELSESADEIISAEIAKVGQSIEKHQDAQSRAQEVAEQATKRAAALDKELNDAKAQIEQHRKSQTALEEKLHEQIASAKALKSDVSHQEKTIATHKEQIASLESLHTALMDSREIDRKDHRSTLKSLESDGAKLRQSIEHVTRQSRAFESSESVLKQKNGALTELIADLKAQKGELRQDTKTLHREHNELLKENGRLEAQLHAERLKLQKLEKTITSRAESKTKTKKKQSRKKPLKNN